MSNTAASPDDGITAAAARSSHPDRYKWIALSNTTIGVLMVTISGSITLISLPNIFDGIRLDPLGPGNTSYFLWMLMGFLLVTAVLVVSFGRIGDMYGRVKMYNLGFAVFTFFSILLSVTWMHGHAGALWLIILRIFQGIGGAFLFANSSAILTDAFPEDQRGLALGINSVAAIAGSFLGLLIGGLLAPIEWRLVFLVCVPFGLFGTVWAYLKLEDSGKRVAAKIDWAGNVTFAIGLISILTGIVYSIQPYGGHTMGWTNPGVIAALAGGALTLATFVSIETKVTDPMFRLHLFRNRAFSAGNLANLLGALGRGGIMFVLILWLQGIWLPQHGYSFDRTPLWAGIYMVPLTIGFLIAGPLSGVLSDRYGARPFATGGMLFAAAAFFLLNLLPIDFGYPSFAAILLVLGLSMGAFASPNRAAVMNSLPPDQRGAGAGMMNTFQNASQVLSIGFFFALITIGMAVTLPARLTSALVGQGVPGGLAHTVGNTPPLDSLFSAFLGENPITTLNKQFRGGILGGRTPTQATNLQSRGFFSHVLSSPFGTGLHYAMWFAVACSLIAAVASIMRGKKYVHGQELLGFGAVDGGPVLAMASTAGAASFGNSSFSSDSSATGEPAPVGVGAGRGSTAARPVPTAGAQGAVSSETNRYQANGGLPPRMGGGWDGGAWGSPAKPAHGDGTNGAATNGHASSGAAVEDGDRPAPATVVDDPRPAQAPGPGGELVGRPADPSAAPSAPDAPDAVADRPPSDDGLRELSVTFSLKWTSRPPRRR